MTELEAFRHYSESAGPFIDYSSVKRAWKAACEWQRSMCNEELVMLRQRVVELEEWKEAASETIDTYVDLLNGQDTKLAALRQQDNPDLTVVYMSGFHDGKKSAQPVQQGEPVATDVIYSAWHGAGIDIIGGDWTRFVGMLPPLYTAPPTCFSAGDMAEAAAKAAQVEREECAKVCDAQASEPECHERAQYCADAIRNRA